MIGACECWFLDVGQGSSSVILLGKNRAIVIDCGPRGSRETVTLLKEQHVDTIECLAITHNHEDHDGNVAAVLSAYSGATRDICFLNDKSHDIRTLAVLNSDPTHKKWPEPRRLETEGATPKKLYSDSLVQLSVVYPHMQDNVNARQVNETSAVLLLEALEFKILFSGDATLDGWETIARSLKNPPLKCDIMTVPHHGGRITDGEDDSVAHGRLYSKIINPTYGIISVGTSNGHGHPSQEAISALIVNKARVLCTQMTGNCSGNLEGTRQIGRVQLQPARSKRQPDFTSVAKKSRNVACCGTIVVEIRSDRYYISPNPDSVPECLMETEEFSPMCKEHLRQSGVARKHS